MIRIQYPVALLFIIPVILALIFIVRRNFIRFRSREEEEIYIKERKGIRTLMLISRIIIFIYLIIAISSPYMIKEKVVPGDASLTILADNSTSFELFEAGAADEIKDKIGSAIPTRLRYLASGEGSAIGDGLLANMHGNDNLLAITDGQNTKGRSLGSMMMLANSLNSTISIIEMHPIKSDMAIKIEGPSETIVGTENTFWISISQVGESLPYSLELTVDDAPVSVPDGSSGLNSFQFPLKLTEGYHKLAVKMNVDDYFSQNNIYYKTVHVLPKPNILFVTEKPSRLLDSIQNFYETEINSEIPAELGKYHAVIINDLKASVLNDKTAMLSDYVADGNGLLVIGGKNSFDYGGYENSFFETIMPVVVGEAEGAGPGIVNIVVLIDVSGSTGLGFAGSTGQTKVDVEKALAVRIVNDIRKDDQVAVVAFREFSYIISELSVLAEKPELNNTVARLTFGGGTAVGSGLWRANILLANAVGGKNVIVISDGITTNEGQSLTFAKSMAEQGIKIYTVGVGADTNRQFMRALAAVGNGLYFEPAETQHLKILFGEPDEDIPDEMKLAILTKEHFITKELSLDATISGFNAVAPKLAARTLVTTLNSKPILTAWRFGLGRIAALTTDDGTEWAATLLTKDNSRLITRSVNWVIGDPARTKDFDVKVKDTSLGEPAEIKVVSPSKPTSDGLSFHKAAENIYSAEFNPTETGFKEFFDAVFAVNYNKEYESMGVNPELLTLVQVTNGKIFSRDDIEGLISFIKENSKRTKSDIAYLRWPLTLIALLVLLAEIGIRRWWENKYMSK